MYSGRYPGRGSSRVISSLSRHSSPQLLHGFYHAVCDQVGLPINRLWMSQLALSGSSAVQALRDELQGVQVDIESRSSQQYVQGKPPAGITLDALSRHLADHTARYNLAIAQSAIDALKSEIRERLLGLKKAKLKWGWGAWFASTILAGRRQLSWPVKRGISNPSFSSVASCSLH